MIYSFLVFSIILFLFQEIGLLIFWEFRYLLLNNAFLTRFYVLYFVTNIIEKLLFYCKKL
nr:MAG TPA: hypothetical protein [Caudoviricetes sp.]